MFAGKSAGSCPWTSWDQSFPRLFLGILAPEDDADVSPFEMMPRFAWVLTDGWSCVAAIHGPHPMDCLVLELQLSCDCPTHTILIGVKERPFKFRECPSLISLRSLSEQIKGRAGVQQSHTLFATELEFIWLAITAFLEKPPPRSSSVISLLSFPTLSSFFFCHHICHHHHHIIIISLSH